MLGTNEFPEISLKTEYSRYDKRALIYELIIPEEQRLILKNYLLGKCDAFDEKAMMEEIIALNEYEKITSYVAHINDISIEIVKKRIEFLLKSYGD